MSEGTFMFFDVVAHLYLHPETLLFMGDATAMCCRKYFYMYFVHTLLYMSSLSQNCIEMYLWYSCMSI